MKLRQQGGGEAPSLNDHVITPPTVLKSATPIAGNWLKTLAGKLMTDVLPAFIV